ncbi:hypothetical protein IFM89_033151 [Coptis chinensis]|uniref:Programmed cell death protein 4-like n=1 Tax=Coptis chinensis TaxID=261450 RepID=A0A835IG34_9MAGN|nr:hypothetical protein IFM89_033151 [Coptis chinensis]
MKDSGKSGKVNGKYGQQDGRKDRRSASGLSGSPKKGGHGGKFTWAGIGFSHVEIGMEKKYILDKKDPNFEDEEEEEM